MSHRGSDDFVDNGWMPPAGGPGSADAGEPRPKPGGGRGRGRGLLSAASGARAGVRLGINFITRNGNLHHKTPVSPPSDVNELEYVSALHQCASMQALRDDASLTSQEIAHFLRSRHGLEVDAETVRTAVLQNGLTADRDDDDDVDDGVDGGGGGGGGDAAAGGCEAGVMDLVELASALVIPFLLKVRNAPETRRALSALSARSLRRTSSGGGAGKRADEERDADVLRDALTNVLEDCTGDASPKGLSEKLVRDVLRGFGEGALADDDGLVREMVEVASASIRGGGSGDGEGRDEDGGEGDGAAGSAGEPVRRPSPSGATPRLDLEAFLEALTSDVNRRYDPGRFERRSTNFEDVWLRDDGDGDGDGDGGRPPRSADLEGGGGARTDRPTELVEEELHQKFARRRSRSGSGGTDAGGEAKRGGGGGGRASAAAVSSPTSVASLPSPASASSGGGGGAGVVRRLYTGQPFDYTADNYRTRAHILFLWAAFVAFWVAYLRTGGYRDERCNADGSARTEVVCPLIGGIVNQLLMISELVIFGTPFIILGSIGNSIEGRESFPNLIGGIVLFTGYCLLFYCLKFTVPFWVSTEITPWMNNVALGCGLAVALLQCTEFVMRFFRVYRPRQTWYSGYFALGNVHYESVIKRSGLFKVRRMLHNAQGVHRRVVRNKEMKKREEELAEGKSSNFLSNFGMALNEYIKLDGRTTYIGGIGWTWEKIRDGTLFEEEGIWISGRVAAGTVFQIILIFAAPVAYYFALPRFLEYLNPEYEELGSRAKVSLGVGITFAVITSVTVTVLFIPTMVATTLKFRRGALPSLRSEDFLHRYRFALDQATLVYGGMFWGVLFSSVAMALLSGGFVYLLLWERTSRAVLSFIGNLLGLSVVLVTKIIIMQIIRFTHYAAFYRTKPFRANIMTVVMEVYAIGISIWFMVARTIKIIIIGALYVGRIDTPLFANGIGIFGPLELDNWPTVTRKEILIHEAHRHPWIETLGYIYMMQLRYGNGYAKRACSAWRLIFVLALMPWLHKYRDMTRPEHFGDEEEDNDGTAGYMNSLFGNDTGMRRQYMQMIQKSQFFKKSSRALLVDIEEEDGNSESGDKPDKSAPNSKRIAEIEEEMRRLQSKLDALKGRTVVGQEMASGE